MEKGASLGELLDQHTSLQTWLLADALFYTLNILLNKHASAYEAIILGMLDVFLFVAKDDREKLRIFHTLPKLFLLHLRAHPLLTLLTAFFVVVHLLQHRKARSIVVLFAAITLAIFGASFGVSKIICLGLFCGVLAAYMHLWETTEIPPPQEETNPVPELCKDDPLMKDQTIAQDLVSKLKRLKAATIIDQEKTRKMFHLNKDRSTKSRRSRSVINLFLQ